VRCLGIPPSQILTFGEVLSTNTLETLLDDLHDLAQQEPEIGSRALSIDGKQCGYVSPRAFGTISRYWPALVSDTTVNFCSGDHLTEQLAQVAGALLDAGCIPKWRDELLDVWCENNAVAAIERGAVRSLGLLTRAVHLNAWSLDGRLWAARRALDKATDPGMWDTLVGGLVGHGEPDELALERESEEEAGLLPGQIAQRQPLVSVYRMRRRVPEGYQYEEVLTCDCVLTEGVIPQNQDGEVMQIECLSPTDVQSMLLEGLFTVEASIVIAQSLLARQRY